MKKILFLMVFLDVLGLTVIGGDVYAAGSVTGKIDKVRMNGDGRAMAIFDINIGGTPPGCVHPAYANALAFDAGTTEGKSVLAFVLAANATGATVTAYGLGVCGVYGGTNAETWSYGVIQ